MQATGPHRSVVRRLAVAAAVAALAVCSAAHARSLTKTPQADATASSDSLTVEDPFESLNRRFYAIHQGIDHAILRPLALGYSHATAGPIGKALHNFVTEIGEPVVFGNDVLQLRIKRAATTLARFVLNGTVGLAGLLDPATGMGLPYHDNGFGTTLGRYGIRPGPYIFLPLVGPTTLRDLIGTGMDFYSDPLGRFHYHDRGDVLVGITVISGLDERANAESDLQQIEAMGTDSYATLRSLYTQKRAADIHGEAPVKIEDLPSFDDPAAPATAAPTPADKAPAATDPGVSAPSDAKVPIAASDSGPDAAWFLTAPAPPPGPSAGPPIQL